MNKSGIDWAAYREMAKAVDSASFDEPGEEELFNPSAMLTEIMDLYDKGPRKGISAGWSSMDAYYTVRPGELTVITGIPGHGKSSWLDNVMINISRSHDWKWAVFSAENYPVASHIATLSEIYTGKPYRKGPTARMTKDDMQAAVTWLGDHFRFIRPKEDRYSLDRIVQIAFTVEGVSAIVIDPWNELDHSRPKDIREDEFISTCLTKLRWFARNAEIHVFIVAHPGKYSRIHGQPKPVITLNEVKGASEWYAKADNGLSVWRDEMDDTGATDVHIQKIRFREVGRAGGAVRLYYDRVSGRFSDPGHRPNINELMARPRERFMGAREPGDEDDE